MTSESDINVFASRLHKLVKNESMKLSGCDKWIKFDSCIKCLALSQFLEFCKTGCKKLRENSLEILPSVRTNDQNRSHFLVITSDTWFVPQGTEF